MGAPNKVTARSTISIARSTPAQNPRGLANRICIRFLPSFKQGIQQKTGRAHRNGGIGHVECRKIRSIPMKVNEVYDMPQADTVNEIAERPAEHEREPAGQQSMRAALQSQQPHNDANAHDNGKSDEQPALPAGCGSQKAERSAHIVHPRNVEDRQYADVLEFTEVLRDIALADLIRQNYADREEQPPHRPAALQRRNHAKRRSSPGPSTLITQREQISGCLGSLPTSARS